MENDGIVMHMGRGFRLIGFASCGAPPSAGRDQSRPYGWDRSAGAINAPRYLMAMAFAGEATPPYLFNGDEVRKNS